MELLLSLCMTVNKSLKPLSFWANNGTTSYIPPVKLKRPYVYIYIYAFLRRTEQDMGQITTKRHYMLKQGQCGNAERRVYTRQSL